MGNTFSTNFENITTNQETDTINNNDLKEKNLIKEDEDTNYIKNIKKSSNYDEIECIDDYCNNYYINGQKNIEELKNKDKDEYENKDDNKDENEDENMKDENINITNIEPQINNINDINIITVP